MTIRQQGRRRGTGKPVGSRVRLRRKMLGLSQTKLGEAIGVTFQQLQKYEHGRNRISAGRLHDLSRVLNVPVSFFFDDMDPVRALPPSEPCNPDLLRKPETIELVRAYYSIGDPMMREHLFELAKALNGAGDTKKPSRRR